MKVTVEPGSISGIIIAPPSKSITQRAYAAALLHKGTTIISNAGQSADELAALSIIQQLGATISGNGTTIVSNGIRPASGSINCGESGLAARLFTPIAALSSSQIRIDGKGTLLKRPMPGLMEVFTQLQVQLADFHGFVPFSLKGPLVPADITLDAADGSQLLSGILVALAYGATQPVTISVAELKSKPYIDLTLEMLAHFGRPVSHNDYREFYIDPAKFAETDPVQYTVEGDWSGASFFLIAAAIAGEITMQHLRPGSKQADTAVLDVLKNTGADVSISADAVTVRRSHLKPFEFDATHCPDLFPILSILAACCEGESAINGVHRLFHKESNRAESVSEMLQNFDVPFSIEGDTLCITGVRKLSGTVIDSFNDHRIAMAAAIGALRARTRVDILNAEAVKKSYPEFYIHLQLCGARCILA